MNTDVSVKEIPIQQSNETFLKQQTKKKSKQSEVIKAIEKKINKRVTSNTIYGIIFNNLHEKKYKALKDLSNEKFRNDENCERQIS